MKNVKQAFEELGEPVKAEKCPGIEGLKKEHDDFVANESPSPEVLNAFLTGAAARTEHYEIAAYEGLVTMAQAMGEDEVAPACSTKTWSRRRLRSQRCRRSASASPKTARRQPPNDAHRGCRGDVSAPPRVQNAPPGARRQCYPCSTA